MATRKKAIETGATPRARAHGRQPAAAARSRARQPGARASGKSVRTVVRDEARLIAGEAVQAVRELAAQASQNTLAANPLIGIRGRDVASAGAALLKAFAQTPRGGAKSLVQYFGSLRAIAAGDSSLEPDAKDRRFADPAWRSSWIHRRLLQAYLATQQQLDAFIASTDLTETEKSRARFFSSLVADALAPSNWLLGNPAAIRKIVDTGGSHLVDGLRNLVHDVRHNHMLPSSVDMSTFQVGKNLATTPGEVVFRSEFLELIQYTPTTDRVHARPLLMSPPQVNKFYGVDLSPDKSLVRWALDSGVQMFMVSWRNPTAEHRDWGLEQYALALDEAVDAVREITGSPDVNVWGSCSGGITLAAYLGWLAARGERKVANSTWAVCILDSQAALQDSTLGHLVSPASIAAAKAHSRRKGVVEGAEMAAMFAWLRPNDLIWNYWVNNYLLGNKPPAFDVLAWNADTTRLPARYHADLLDLVETNPFARAGELTIAGAAIDLRRVKCGTYVVGGITDHITPWTGCYGTARLLGRDATFVLANAGHLQSLLNPPGAPKAFFFAGPATAKTANEWSKKAARHEGSWWPHWREWIQARSGDLVAAPRAAGSVAHPALGAAPGTYVLAA